MDIGSIVTNTYYSFSSPEPKAHKVSIKVGTPAGVRPSVRSSVHLFTLSNINISAASGQITTKFDLKKHLVGGTSALGFGPDRIGALV